MNAEPADKAPEAAAKNAAADSKTAAPVAKTATPAAKPAAKKAAAPTRQPANRAGDRTRGGARRAKPAGRKTGGREQAGRQQADDATSKAGLIRKVASIIKAKGAKPRPSEIVKILGEEGVKVSAAQVSQTLKAAGYRPLRQRRGARKPAAGPGKTGGSGASHHISLDDLLAAKSVAGAFGGTDKAIAALEALKRLER